MRSSLQYSASCLTSHSMQPVSPPHASSLASSSVPSESRSLLHADAEEQDEEAQQQLRAESHLTFRSLFAGAVVGVSIPFTSHPKLFLIQQQAFVVAMNINFGLKVGWTQGGNILAAVVGIR